MSTDRWTSSASDQQGLVEDVLLLVVGLAALAAAMITALLPIEQQVRTTVVGIELGAGALVVLLLLLGRRWQSLRPYVAGPVLAAAVAVPLYLPETYPIALGVVLVVVAVVTAREGAPGGARALIVGCLGMTAVELVLQPDRLHGVLGAVVYVSLGVALIASIGLVRHSKDSSLDRLVAIDEAVQAFVKLAQPGSEEAAVMAGIESLLGREGYVALDLGDDPGSDDETTLLLDAAIATRGPVQAPEGLRRRAETVLVGMPILHGAHGEPIGSIVVRAASSGTDAELELVDGFLRRVAPALERVVEVRVAAAAGDGPVSLEHDELVSHAAHDLRVPLASLASAVDTLATHGERLTNEQRDELHGVLARSTRRISSWVTMLLEDSLRGHTTTATPRIVPVRTLLEEAHEATGSALSGLEVKIHATDLVADADPGLVIRALSNLLANAGHHAASGGGTVELGARTVGRSIELTVLDHGPGLRAAAVRDLGARSDGRSNGEASGAGPGPGLGLGLVSVRRLVSAWGGAVGVRETPGGGATVWMTVPAAGGRVTDVDLDISDHATRRWSVVDQQVPDARQPAPFAPRPETQDVTER